MADRTRSSIHNSSGHRSQSSRNSRDKVTRTASELHRQTVDRAQRQFEEQLANSEREVRWVVRQRRNHSSSPAEKRQATRHLQQLRTALNNDYANLIQVYVHEHKDKVDEVGKYMNQRYENERQLDQTITERKVQEAIQQTQLQSDRARLESINQIVRQRDAICEEKLTAQKNRYNRLLDEQARRLRAEQVYQSNRSLIPIEQFDIAQLKGRLARVEYEQRELKQLVFNLRSDLTTVITQPPTYRSIVNIPNFVVKP